MNPENFIHHILQEAEPLYGNGAVVPDVAYENGLTTMNAVPRNEEGILFGVLAVIGPDPYAGFALRSQMATLPQVSQ